MQFKNKAMEPTIYRQQGAYGPFLGNLCSTIGSLLVMFKSPQRVSIYLSAMVALSMNKTVTSVYFVVTYLLSTDLAQHALINSDQPSNVTLFRNAGTKAVFSMV